MADTYNRDINAVPSFLANSETFAVMINSTRVGLVQNVGYRYSQNVVRVDELGSHDARNASARSQGSLEIGRLIGSSNGSNNTVKDIFGEEFFTAHGSAGGTMILRDLNTGKGFQAKGCIVTSVGANVGAQSPTITEGVSISVLSFEEI